MRNQGVSVGLSRSDRPTDASIGSTPSYATSSSTSAPPPSSTGAHRRTAEKSAARPVSSVEPSSCVTTSSGATIASGPFRPTTKSTHGSTTSPSVPGTGQPVASAPAFSSATTVLFDDDIHVPALHPQPPTVFGCLDPSNGHRPGLAGQDVHPAVIGVRPARCVDRSGVRDHDAKGGRTASMLHG